MNKELGLLNMIYSVWGLASAIVDAQEQALDLVGKIDPDKANKLASLCYLMEDYMEEVKEAAEAELGFSRESKIAALQRDNEKLGKMIVELQMKIHG